jgi:hypothetical protein
VVGVRTVAQAGRGVAVVGRRRQLVAAVSKLQNVPYKVSPENEKSLSAIGIDS